MFRHGAVEAVEARLLDPGQVEQREIPGAYLVEQLLERIPKYLAVQREMGVELPVVILLELVGVMGYKLAAGQRWLLRGVPVDRDLITCPEVIVEDWGADVATILRPALDAIWNAGGYAECGLYDETGAWRGE